MKAGHTQCAEALCEVLRKKCKFIIIQFAIPYKMQLAILFLLDAGTLPPNSSGTS